MIAQAVMFGFKIGEISCPTKYFEEASSINFKRSVKYGLGVLATTAVLSRTRWEFAARRASRPEEEKSISITTDGFSRAC